MKLVSDAVLNEKCPHFPILYSDIKCTKFFNFRSDSSQIKEKEIENIKNYPERNYSISY